MYTIFIYSLKVTAGAFYESSINATVRPQQNSWWIQAICKQEKEIGKEKKLRRTLNRVHVTIRIFALSHCLYLKCLFVCVCVVSAQATRGPLDLKKFAKKESLLSLFRQEYRIHSVVFHVSECCNFIFVPCLISCVCERTSSRICCRLPLRIQPKTLI